METVKFQSIFSLIDFHNSRPCNEIYAAQFMYPAFIFRPSTCICFTFHVQKSKFGQNLQQ